MLGASAELVEGMGELIVLLWPSFRDINLKDYLTHALILVNILDVFWTGLFKWAQNVEENTWTWASEEDLVCIAKSLAKL